MEYFNLFDIPVSFHLDEAALKASFIKLSRECHPDHFTLASEEKQEEMLERSTQINNAYKVLNNFDQRLHYILTQKGVLEGEGQDKLPQAFLMDMMDINETIMDLQFDPDPAKTAQAKEQIAAFDAELQKGIESVLQSPDAVHKEEALSSARDYYLKKKYLKRIYENLDKVGRM